MVDDEQLLVLHRTEDIKNGHYPGTGRLDLAAAPGYPQGSAIGAVACSPDDADHSDRQAAPAPAGERVVWISEGTSIGYLPEIARTALGRNWT